MKRKFKKIFVLCALLCISLSATACGDETPEEQVEEQSIYDNLQNNTFYIQRSDNTLETLCTYPSTFGFDGVGVDTPSNGRIIWMTEDLYNTIPTIYTGDKLIYYTTDVINETFTYERFEDLGYSIGLCGLYATKSGRYGISTSEEVNNTYPSGDTADLKTFANEMIIMDEFGGNLLRAKRDENQEFIYDENLFSRCGTILGLTKDKQYSAKIYAGTELYNYTFTADKRIFASMETTHTVDYVFENEVIANIIIPQYYNSGYYTINNIGLFRYVKDTSFNENTDFNIGNIPTIDTLNIDYSIYSSQDTSESISDNVYNPDGEYGPSQDSFEIDELGNYNITVDIEFNDSEYGMEGVPETTAYVVNPSRTKKWTLNGNMTCLKATLNATETGTYTIYYDYTDNRDIYLNVTKIK